MTSENPPNQTVETHPTRLRKLCRQARNALTPQQQAEHAQQAMRHLLRQGWLQRPKKIALFLAQDGELETTPLMQALAKHHQLYLPVLKTKRGRSMAFAPYHPMRSRLYANQFNILEPISQHQHHLFANQLDIIILPLTCFDSQKNRMGMGGGFYDRALRFKRFHPNIKPKLIGWAHQCQQVTEITPRYWDIPLDAIVTELGVIK